MEYPEDQQKFILPLNRETEKLYYNQRIIIDAPVLTEPRVWRISKINRVAANGLALFTAAQDQYDEHTDYTELDDDGNVIGLWASYYDTNGNEPDVPARPEKTIHSVITYSGKNDKVVIKGNFKKMTVTFYDGEEEVAPQNGVWSFAVNDIDVSEWIQIKTSEDDTTLSSNQIKIKFVGDDSYIGENLMVSHISDNGIKSSVRMELVGL